MNYSTYERDHYARLEQIKDLKALDPVEFERFIGSLFERMGYTVKTTPASGDNGVDLFLTKEGKRSMFLTKEGKRSIVQCKRYDNLVGSPVVRDFYGTMLHNHADQAFLITTGVFSLPAQTWALGKSINLVDGHLLYEWIQLVKPPPLNRPPMLPPPPLPLPVEKPLTKRITSALLVILAIVFGLAWVLLALQSIL